MIFLWLIFALLFGDYCNASVSLTPDWEKVSGKTIPDVQFVDAKENVIRLSDFKDKIIILHPMFTHCPSTCAFISSRLSTAIKSLSAAERNSFEVLSFSFDPKETSESLAKFEKMFQIDRSYWKVVRADNKIIQQLLAALDFRTLELSSSNYEHPNLLFIVGNDRILRDYIYGSDLSSKRLSAILRSSENSNWRLSDMKSYMYVVAMIGLLISAFVTAFRLTKVQRQSANR
jgi:protein SCO1/2